MWRSRSLWASALAVAYVAFAALRATDGRSVFAWIALGILPALLLAVWARTTSPSEPEIAHGEVASAARAAAVGAAAFVASQTGPEAPWLLALGNVGAFVASIASLWALARLSGRRGMLPEEPAARRLDAAAFASLFWTVAVALPATRAFFPERMAALDPLADDYATVAASIGSMGVSVVALFRTRVVRRFELGAADRANAALSLAILALVLGVAVAGAGVAAAHTVLPATATGAACAIAWAAVTARPAALGRVLRVAALLAFGGTPVALAAVYVTHVRPGRAGGAVLAACAACAALGLGAALLDRRLSRGPVLFAQALEKAARAAGRPDPDEALEEALLALARPAPDGNVWRSPALYRLHPPEVVTVDRAGYAHVERGELPPGLLELAQAEPEGVLRAEVLRAGAVRKPEVRAMLAWLDDRPTDAVVVLHEGADPLALLALPRGERTGPMPLEEALALRVLADRLGAIVAVSAALARSRARELTSRERAESEGAEAERLADVIDHQAGRLRAVAEMLARPARVAAYSPAARTAIESLERLGESGRPVTLLLAPGLDPVPWAAVAHLVSDKRDGALVFVESASGRAIHDVATWRDVASSPLVAARDGTLVLLDAHALPLDVQRYIAIAAGPDVGLIVALYATVDALVGQGRIDENLADRLGDRAVALPPFAARAEDLRGLLLDRLARIGERLRGQPMGLAPQALSALTEHEWPGNDAEMEAVLVRAALVSQGDLIGLAALRASGFGFGGELTDAASAPARDVTGQSKRPSTKPPRASGATDRSRDPSDRSRDPSDRSRDPSDRPRDPSDRSRDPSDRSRGSSDRSRDPSDRSRASIDRPAPRSPGPKERSRRAAR